jgi:hypothetical protein
VTSQISSHDGAVKPLLSTARTTFRRRGIFGCGSRPLNRHKAAWVNVSVTQSYADRSLSSRQGYPRTSNIATYGGHWSPRSVPLVAATARSGRSPGTRPGRLQASTSGQTKRLPRAPFSGYRRPRSGTRPEPELNVFRERVERLAVMAAKRLYLSMHAGLAQW